MRMACIPTLVLLANSGQVYESLNSKSVQKLGRPDSRAFQYRGRPEGAGRNEHEPARPGDPYTVLVVRAEPCVGGVLNADCPSPSGWKSSFCSTRKSRA